MVIALLAALASAGSDDRPVSFHRFIGQWTIVGDEEVGGCLMYPGGDRPTKLVIAAVPNSDALQISLSNPAWKSLSDDNDARVDATFSKDSGITDSWRLASKFTSAQSGGPRINVEIERARNDGASFVEQLRSSGRLTFWRGTIALGSYDLKGSAAAVDALKLCRTHLRMAPGFDPFAN